MKGTNESVTRVDSSVPLMNYDLSDLQSLILIQITPKECTLIVLHAALPIGITGSDSLVLLDWGSGCFRKKKGESMNTCACWLKQL